MARERYIPFTHNQQRIREQTSALEGQVRNIKDTMGPLKSDVKIALMRADVNALQAQVPKNMKRGNNIRMVKFPEKIEGVDLTEFAEQLLLATISKDNLSPLFTLERAHSPALQITCQHF